MSVFDLIAAQRLGQIVGRDRLVRPGGDPGFGDVAVTALLELLEQIVEAAGENAARGAAGQQTAQAVLEDVAEAAAGAGTLAWSSEQPARRAPRPAWLVKLFTAL